MLRGSFGKRVAPVAPPVMPDPMDQTRILPAAVWDGPAGDTLRQTDFTPDHPGNLALTPERGRAMEDAATARMNAIVAKVNAHVPGVSVIPWAMIPWSIWEGLNAEFLIQSDFLPSSPWNNLLLPADAASADFLGLPEHPRAPQPGLDEQLARLVTELRMARQDEVQRGMPALSRGDWSVIDRFEESNADRFKKLNAMARYVADLVFGPEVLARHDELFGFGLSLVID